MNLNRYLLPALCAGLALASTAQAQSTQNLTINGGTGFSGMLDGTITATVKAQNTGGTVQTQGVLNVTDLDIQTINDGGFLNLFPNSTSNNNTASTVIAINPTSIGIDLQPTAFSSPVSGSVSVTAGDATANEFVGVLDGGVAGADGAWDDPGSTGILNSATADSFNVVLNNPINAIADVTGGISAAIPSDVTIPDVVDTTLLNADLRVKSSSTVNVNFEPIQNVTLSGLSISNSTPIGLNTPASGNFVDGAHPVPGANATLDLSTSGVGLVETTISGSLIADIMGTITGSIDIAADISVIGLINFTVDQNDVVDGLLSDGVVSLIDLNEEVSLPGTELPFSISVIHNATTNVDFDDVVAQLLSGTFGFDVPISLSETDIILDLPDTSFELSNLSTYVDAGSGQHGYVNINHLAATLGGQFVLDLDADLTLSADLLATALGENAINVVPEPGSLILLAFAGLGLVGYGYRRRRR